MQNRELSQWVAFLALIVVVIALVLFLKLDPAAVSAAEQAAVKAKENVATVTIAAHGSPSDTSVHDSRSDASVHSELKPHFIYEGRTYWLSDLLETSPELPEDFTEVLTVEEIVASRAVDDGQANGCEVGSTVYACEKQPELCYLLPPDGTVYFRYDFAG